MTHLHDLLFFFTVKPFSKTNNKTGVYAFYIKISLEQSLHMPQGVPAALEQYSSEFQE